MIKQELPKLKKGRGLSSAPGTPENGAGTLEPGAVKEDAPGDDERGRGGAATGAPGVLDAVGVRISVDSFFLGGGVPDGSTVRLWTLRLGELTSRVISKSKTGIVPMCIPAEDSGG